MPKQQIRLIAIVLIGLLFANLPAAFAQALDPSTEIFNKIKNSVVLLNDGQTQAYGLYLARARDKKFMYVLATDRLAIGVEGKIRVTRLDGKVEDLKAAKLSASDTMNVAIYKIASAPKQLQPITRLPQESVSANISLWALSRPEIKQNRLKLRLVKPANNLANTFLGSPIFDSRGRVIGSMTSSAKFPPSSQAPESYQIARIAELLRYATKALYGLELNPIWKEVYPTQFIVEQVKESVALLDTRKNGAGIFLGLDKKKNGYILTAAHVVAEETGPFSVQFPQHEDEQIIGETIPATIDPVLDLAIVRVPACPPIKPVTFMRTDSVKKIERYFVKQAGTTVEYTVASIGYDDNLFWRHKFGGLVSITDKTFETNLPLESGDSGGPTFNEKGEIIGLNLKTTGAASSQESVSANAREILKYLDNKLGQVDFAVKWSFQYYPGFWRKNRMWILPASAATVAGVSSVLATREPKVPLADSPKTPSRP